MRLVLLCALVLVSTASAAALLPLSTLTLPPGFHLSVYSADVPSAREIAIGDKGTVFVGSMGAGNVYARTDRDHDRHRRLMAAC